MAVLNKYVYQTVWLAKCITVAVVIQITCCLKQKGQKPSGSYNLHFLDSLQLVLIKQHLRTERSIFTPGSIFLGLTHPRHQALALISERLSWITERFMVWSSATPDTLRVGYDSLKPNFEYLLLSGWILNKETFSSKLSRYSGIIYYPPRRQPNHQISNEVSLGCETETCKNHLDVGILILFVVVALIGCFLLLCFPHHGFNPRLHQAYCLFSQGLPWIYRLRTVLLLSWWNLPQVFYFIF